MKFDWDIKKSSSNQEKHGISFEEASKLFYLESATFVPARTIGNEKRIALIVDTQGKFWTVIHTTRDRVIRIISARRSSKGEINVYKKIYNE